MNAYQFARGAVDVDHLRRCFQALYDEDDKRSPVEKLAAESEITRDRYWSQFTFVKGQD